jgi:DNA-binding NarL/FixJ family response regulator
MTSGRKLTEEERWSILRLHDQGATWAEIGYELALDYRTVKDVVCDAARSYYRMTKPNILNELSDPH